MTTVEKRKFLELIERCVKWDVLLDEDAEKIIAVCDEAVDREIANAEGKL